MSPKNKTNHPNTDSTVVLPGLVSTIIPVHNRPLLLVDAVDSVLAQDYRPIEIIIVDDGSTDHTLSVAKDLVAKYPDEVKLAKQVCSGPGVARETGRRLARGEFLQYLDSDDLLFSSKFSVQVKAFNNNPEAGICYGKETRVKLGEEDFDPEHSKARSIKSTGDKIDGIFPKVLQGTLWGTSVPLWRRTLTDAMGPWQALINEEDIEYDARAGAQGAELCYVPEFVAMQRVHNQHLSANSAVDVRKLKHRAHARQLIYHHALQAQVPPKSVEMRHFSKSTFLLARQCAARGMVDKGRALLALAQRSYGRVTVKHRIFSGILSVLGLKLVQKFVVLCGGPMYFGKIGRRA